MYGTELAISIIPKVMNVKLIFKKGSPIKAGVNGKKLFHSRFFFGCAWRFLSIGFKALDSSLLFLCSISGRP